MQHHEPQVSKITAHYCGRCGEPIMFDPRTLRPYHVLDGVPPTIRREIAPQRCDHIVGHMFVRRSTGGPFCAACGMSETMHHATSCEPQMSPFTRRALARELPAADMTGLVRMGMAL